MDAIILADDGILTTFRVKGVKILSDVKFKSSNYSLISTLLEEFPFPFSVLVLPSPKSRYIKQLSPSEYPIVLELKLAVHAVIILVLVPAPSLDTCNSVLLVLVLAPSCNSGSRLHLMGMNPLEYLGLDFGVFIHIRTVLASDDNFPLLSVISPRMKHCIKYNIWQ